MNGPMKSSVIHDVCIIGSGAAGGIAAYVLSKAGLNVLLLEAGPWLDPEKDFKQHLWPYQHATRGATADLRDDAFFAPNVFAKIPGEPYTHVKGTKFVWWRSRILGGRTNHWGRHAFRFSPADFHPHDADGLGENWPIGYDEIAPYYDKVESLIGVFGAEDHSPDYPDGVFMPAPRPRCTELFIKRVCDKAGIPCITNRAAIITKPLNGRQACHYCHQCSRGCKAGSAFTSTQVCLPPAIATGRLQIITNAMAREIMVGRDGKARAVSYVDRITRTEKEIRTRAVMAAAGACESARLLLNSRSSQFPCGLANSSGVIGRFLTDHICVGGYGYFPQLGSIPPHNHDGTGPPHLFIAPRRPQNVDFPRGYHIEFRGGRYMPFVGGFQHEVCAQYEGYGLDLKKRCRRDYGCHMYFTAVGEMVSEHDSLCELDPAKVDEWGIPVLRFSFKRTARETSMAKHMQDTIRSLVDAGGGTYSPYGDSSDERPHGLSLGGECFHEIGVVRMGNNPQHSALNQYCQSHDVPNVFVIDGACFSSNPDKPSTLTIMALAWRAAEHLVESAKKLTL